MRKLSKLNFNKATYNWGSAVKGVRVRQGKERKGSPLAAFLICLGWTDSEVGISEAIKKEKRKKNHNEAIKYHPKFIFLKINRVKK